jgi:hypothetical protein
VLDKHVHAIIALRSGLDTRPFRLVLPNDLRWIELDSDVLFLYKNLRLAHITPSCRVEREGYALTDPAEPGAVLRRALHGVARGLLLTENALERFDPLQLSDIAVRVRRGIKWWILSVSSGAAGTLGFIDGLCRMRWRVADYRPLDSEARRLAPDRFASIGPDSSFAAGAGTGAVWLLRRVTRPA